MHVGRCPKEADMQSFLSSIATARSIAGQAGKLLVGLALAVCPGVAAHAQSPSLEQLLSGVVHIKTFITPEGRTTENLGKEREGTGIVIDNNGLVLTIGYLMVEAISAEIATNDGHTVA